MNKTTKIIGLTILLSLIALAAACGGGATSSDMKTIAEKKVNDKLTVKLLSSDGKLKNGKQEIFLAFTDGAGNPVDITAATLNFNMPMPGMGDMNNAAQLTTTGTKGKFKGDLDIEMAGDWTAQISYDGAEKGSTTISTKAQ